MVVGVGMMPSALPYLARYRARSRSATLRSRLISRTVLKRAGEKLVGHWGSSGDGASDK